MKLEDQRFLTETVHPGRKSGAALKRRIAGRNPKVWGLPGKYQVSDTVERRKRGSMQGLLIKSSF